MFSSETTGFAAVISSMEDLKKEAPASMRRAQEKYADLVFARSQYYCPVDRAYLKNSGRKIKTKGFGGDEQIEIVYGSSTAYYALWVHENTQVYHKPPTRAKFLTTAVEETQRQGEEIMAREFSVTYYDVSLHGYQTD